jgi:hypothetical protein
MHKFGLPYYVIIGGVRIPLTGLMVKLVIDQDWENGIALAETPAGTGYYMSAVIPAGIYEIWDNGENAGSFTGKTVQLGAVQTQGFEDRAITNDKIADDAVETAHFAPGAITHRKVADDAVEANNIKDGEVLLEKLSASLKANIASIDALIENIGAYIAERILYPIGFVSMANPVRYASCILIDNGHYLSIDGVKYLKYYKKKVLPPQFITPSATYSTGKQIHITCGTPEATIVVTTDGSEPIQPEYI